jgi:transposase
MTRHLKAPLRSVTETERAALETLSRATSTPADQVMRAKMLLAVADGLNYTEAAHSVGRRSNDAVSKLVSRFNQVGLEALVPAHGGGFAIRYGETEKERLLHEFQRTPQRDTDGTATWSLKTLQRALRQATDGLPKVSTWTILAVLHEAGYDWQKSRTWCQTGQVIRKRKRGKVWLTDPDTGAKKAD